MHRILTVTTITLLIAVIFVRYQTAHAPVLIPQQRLTISGTIRDIPKFNKRATSFHVNGYQISAPPNSDVYFGESIEIYGTITDKGILAAQTITQDQALPFLNQMFGLLARIRNNLVVVPAKFLPEREAALISGIVLGDKKGDYFFIKALQNTGTIHILVVSGANLTILASAILTFRKYINKRVLIILSLVAIWIYAFLTGAQSPALRAAFMASLVSVAKIFGKQTWDLYALFFACFVMMLLNPAIISDISFQLSVAATLGVIVFSMPFIDFLTDLVHLLKMFFVPQTILDIFTTTLAAQLLVDPIILIQFHQFSLFAVVTNMLVLPMVYFMTVVGFLFVIFGSISGIVGQLLGLVLLLPTSYVVSVVTIFNALPGNLITVNNIPTWIYVCYFWVIILLYIALKVRKGYQKA